jgi:hypothetical protein
MGDATTTLTDAAEWTILIILSTPTVTEMIRRHNTTKIFV